MNGRIDAEAREIAFAILNGATAELTEIDTSRGDPVTHMWVDERLVAVPRRRPDKRPAIVVVADGEKLVYVASSEEQARALYQAALRYVDGELHRQATP